MEAVIVHVENVCRGLAGDGSSIIVMSPRLFIHPVSSRRPQEPPVGGADAVQLARLDGEALVVKSANHVGMGEVARPQLLDAGDESIIFQGWFVFGGQVPAAELGLESAFAWVCCQCHWLLLAYGLGHDAAPQRRRRVYGRGGRHAGAARPGGLRVHGARRAAEEKRRVNKQEPR